MLSSVDCNVALLLCVGTFAEQTISMGCCNAIMGVTLTGMEAFAEAHSSFENSLWSFIAYYIEDQVTLFNHNFFNCLMNRFWFILNFQFVSPSRESSWLFNIGHLLFFHFFYLLL